MLMNSPSTSQMQCALNMTHACPPTHACVWPDAKEYYYSPHTHNIPHIILWVDFLIGRLPRSESGSTICSSVRALGKRPAYGMSDLPKVLQFRHCNPSKGWNVAPLCLPQAELAQHMCKIWLNTRSTTLFSCDFAQKQHKEWRNR